MTQYQGNKPIKKEPVGDSPCDSYDDTALCVLEVLNTTTTCTLYVSLHDVIAMDVH